MSRGRFQFSRPRGELRREDGKYIGEAGNVYF